MPHITLEYSANLEPTVDMYGLCTALKDAAAATGVFPPAGIRVRAIQCDHSVVADGDPRHGFIDISVRLRAGRSEDAKDQGHRCDFCSSRKIHRRSYGRQPLYAFARTTRHRSVDEPQEPVPSVIIYQTI